jgi:hypothetical protein
MEVSLPPGDYRYHVRTYNLFDQHEHTSNWASFKVLLALQPAVRSFSPDRFSIEDNFVWELRLEGENFVEGSSVYLEPLNAPGRPVFPRRYIPNPSGTRARLFFDPQDLRTGEYRVVVKNPGGLSDVSPGEPFLIPKSKWLHVALSLSWAPLAPLHGYLFDLFEGFSPIGLSVRSDVVFPKIPWGYLGVEGNLSWNYLFTERNTIEVTGHLGSLELNLFFRTRLSRMVFNVYAGGGLGGVLMLMFDYGAVKSDPINSVMPLLDAGVSFQWYFTNTLFADLGVKYIYIFSTERPQIGYLRPSFGIGWRF